MRIVIDMQGAQSTGSRNRGIGRYTLSLAQAVARNRGGHELALRLRQFVDREAQISAVTEAVEAEAVRRFFAWADKTASVVDHANLLTAIELGCEAILSFDDDFVQIAAGSGIRILR